MKYIFILIVFSLTIMSCKRNVPVSDLTEIRIHSANSNQVNILEMIKDFKIIPLETNDNCLIKQVKSIKSYNDDWYIQDFADVPVKVFSKDGKSVSEIGHKGGGPGEFLHFADFIVDKGAVHIFGWSGNRKWIRYSNSNQFLFETAMSFPFDHICKIDNNNYLAYVGHGTVFDESSYYLVSVHKI